MVALLLAIELLDELVGGTRAAAWPLIRHDLGLSYGQIGLLLAVPGLFGSVLDPLVGALGDSPRCRAAMVAGGIAFAVSAAAVGLAPEFWTLLIALLIGNSATGAFVSLAQATLMDLQPHERVRNMARWTLAGSVGYVAGPVVLAAAIWLGAGWRCVSIGLALCALPLVIGLRHLPNGVSHPHMPILRVVAAALAELRRREVLRWLAMLEAADLLLDVFHGFLALYFVDVVGIRPVEGALAVAVWTGAGLAGDAILLLILRRVDGHRYLRWSAAASLAVYPAFLVVPGTASKLGFVAVLGLLNSGWYAIPKAGLYSALPDRSGAAVALGGIGGLAGALVPLALGMLAEHAGLGTTMWVLVAAPVVLLALARRSKHRCSD
ncbi:MAG TPA: MFS transporter [Gaiellaceae bacterium]